MKKFFKKQLSHLLFGLIIWLPIVILSVISVWIFKKLGDLGRDIFFFLPDSLPSIIYFISVMLLLYLSGIALKKTFIKKLTAKIPVLGIFLGQDESKMMSIERLLSLKPCLFLMSDTLPAYGFIFSEEKVATDNDEAPFSLVNVYLPNNPLMVTGQIYPVRKETVMRLGNSPKEIINLLLYASVSPKSIKFMPWGHETEEEFKKRAENFGLKTDLDAKAQRK